MVAGFDTLDEDGDVIGEKNPTYETELYYGKD